ncbi:LysR family transcriptional regulator [Testudinibacter sp. P27/CKL/0425]
MRGAGSFTKAGQQLGVSKSALSQSISQLENRLNIRLLKRTTRSISPTPEGLQLLNEITPHFAAINGQLTQLAHNQTSATGIVRINASQAAIEMAILPKLAPLLAEYPHIQVELHSDNRFVDIVKAGFDMGVRLGDAVSSDMVAVKISKPVRTAIVASPEYLHDKPPIHRIADLDRHCLIGTRFDVDRPPVAWDFRQEGKLVEYQPKPQLLLNGDPKQAALNHLGLAFVARSQVAAELAQGILVEVLAEFAHQYEPFYAYYPSRKHHSRAFELVLSRLRV